MPYSSVTETITLPLAEGIDRHWANDPQAGFVKNQILARGANAVLIPVSLLTTSADIAIGTVGAVATILTGGLHQPTYGFAHRHLMAGGNHLVAVPYASFLSILNPKAVFIHERDTGYGFISGYVQSKLVDAAEHARESNHTIPKHVISRALYLLLIPVSIITRVADTPIGLIAAAFSIVTFGSFKTINWIAFRGLGTPAVVHDLFFASVKVINPWA